MWPLDIDKMLQSYANFIAKSPSLPTFTLHPILNQYETDMSLKSLVLKCLFFYLQMRGSGGKDEYSPEMLGPCLSIQSVRAGGSPMDTDSRSPRPEMYPGTL